MSEEQEETEEKGKAPVAPLVEESDVPSSSEGQDNFDREVERSLQETEEAVLGLAQVSADPDASKLWAAAGEIVKGFKPVPWFIWRLANFVLGRSDQIGQVSEGLVFGLRRLMFAVASDPTLGSGEKVNSVRKALNTVDSDVIAAASVIHAICRKLGSKEHERIWKPILDDALIRSHLGFIIARNNPEFGGGRGMLAGFSGRAGLTVLIATGELDAARKALELLATGKTIRETGLLTYACDPLQVSAMLLTASGISREAAFGTVSFSIDPINPPKDQPEQARWHAALQATEYVRMNEPANVTASSWELLGCDQEKQDEVLEYAKKIVRRGHGWQWMMG